MLALNLVIVSELRKNSMLETIFVIPHLFLIYVTHEKVRIWKNFMFSCANLCILSDVYVIIQIFLCVVYGTYIGKDLRWCNR